jgi:hypothetical protein
MNDILINFNLDKNEIFLNYKGKISTKKTFLMKITGGIKFIYVEYNFNKFHKINFGLKIYNNFEQFLEIEEYRNEEKINELNLETINNNFNCDVKLKLQSFILNKKAKNPWKTLVKWSHISIPQKGSSQTNDVYRIYYDKKYFDCDVKFNVISSEFGNWNNNNFIEGYYY